MADLEYYITHADKKIGPYDLLSVMRQIRNRKLKSEDLISNNFFETGEPAISFPQLREIFVELETPTEPEKREFTELHLRILARDGLDMLQTTPMLSVLAGVALLIATLGIILFAQIFTPMNAASAASLQDKVIFVLLSACWGGFVFSIFEVLMLRKSRVQLITSDFVLGILKDYGLRIFIASSLINALLFAIPILLFIYLKSPMMLMLIIFPSSFMMLLCLFVPQIITDRDVGIFSAIKTSASLTFRVGMDNFTVIYMLLLVNLIAACFVLPLLLTLPATIIAINMVYDDYFNEY